MLLLSQATLTLGTKSTRREQQLSVTRRSGISTAAANTWVPSEQLETQKGGAFETQVPSELLICVPAAGWSCPGSGPSIAPPFQHPDPLTAHDHVARVSGAAPPTAESTAV